MSELKPCPFCRGVDLGVAILQGHYTVQCATCEASGPWRMTAREAVEHWQARAIEAEVRAELEQDARRYRWLRTQHWHDNKMCIVLRPKENIRLGADCPSRDLLDEAIDAAIRNGGEG
jgi:Lar family restriction alleviation protein